jgi:uncharacterized membrane protein YjgN (DUF898 family)
MSDIAVSSAPTSPIPAALQAGAQLTPSRPVYDGKLVELYAIYFRHLVLMVVTLGWSRFWGRTRLRRYIWNHVSILGDRFEYRGRGIELFMGFVIVLVMVGVWGVAVWAGWKYLLDETLPFNLGPIDFFSVSVAVIGLPLAYAGQYTGLRYRLTRSRWRGIRLGLGGSAWRYGFIASFFSFANAITAKLLTPVMSIALARPRIDKVSVGSQKLEFAGRAGDVYGRYMGYYFLNILAWLVAAGIGIAVFAELFKETVAKPEDVLVMLSQPGLRTLVLVALAAIGLYILFGLLVLPLRCWWQAYLIRYLVSRTRAGAVLFASSLTTGQMWGFMVLNYLIVLLTFGVGYPWVVHRTLRLIANETWIYGAPDGASITQSAALGPRVGEGLIDMFDVSGV